VGTSPLAALGLCCAVLLAPSRARADDTDAPIVVEEMRVSTGVFIQEGRGLQSKAGKLGERGSERAWIIEPLAQIRIRQTPELTHEAFIGIDVVSSASADALDVVSTASRYNGAVTAEVTTTYSKSEDFSFGVRWGAHAEEPLRSVTAGPIMTIGFAQQNTVLSVSGFVVADGFDDLSHGGTDHGFASRATLNGNLSLSQVLSETTLLDLSYGVTEQWGTLENTWNSVLVQRPPFSVGPAVYRAGEKFPDSRNRNALSALVSQHIPPSRSTLKGSYRFYWDENGILAHTAELQLYQYIVPWLWVRGHYRLHVQPEIDFWRPIYDGPVQARTRRTSDSDLERLTSREVGLRVAFVRERAPASVRSADTFDIGYFRYWRSNSLFIDYASFGYMRSF